jgi:hypothetical protein
MGLISRISSFLSGLFKQPDKILSENICDDNKKDIEEAEILNGIPLTVAQTDLDNSSDFQGGDQVNSKDNFGSVRNRMAIVLPQDQTQSISLKRQSINYQAFFSLDYGMSSSSYEEIGGAKKYTIPDSDKSKTSSLQLIGINTNNKKSSFRIVKTTSHESFKDEIDDRDKIEKIFRDHLNSVPSSSISTNKKDGVKNPGNIKEQTARLLEKQGDLMLENNPDPDSIPNLKKRIKGKMRRGFVNEKKFIESNKNIKTILELQKQDETYVSQVLRSSKDNHSKKFFVL